MKPKFSIIIPSYNQGKFITQTIDSILSQSYKNIEILVIDGGSTDETIDILKTYGDKIFWLSEKDRGQTHAINKGLAMAKGDIIAYLNSDDYYLEGSLERVANIFESNKGSLWCTGDYLIVDENGNTIQNLIGKYKTFFRNRISLNILSVLNPINQPSTFLSKKLIDKVGLFNESLHYVMDYEYWLKAIQFQNPIIIQEKLSGFRIHTNSKGGSQYNKQFKEEFEIAKAYQKNSVMIFLHYLHNRLIQLVYAFIK